MINGVTKLFMTKADVLSGFSSVKVCTSYLVNGKETNEIPFEHDADIEPVYVDLPGWKENISEIRDYDKLPQTLRDYIKYIEEQTEAPVTMVSVGPDRTETIFR